MPSIAHPAQSRTEITTDDWITPKWLVDRLGPFVLIAYGEKATDRLHAASDLGAFVKL